MLKPRIIRNIAFFVKTVSIQAWNCRQHRKDDSQLIFTVFNAVLDVEVWSILYTLSNNLFDFAKYNCIFQNYEFYNQYEFVIERRQFSGMTISGIWALDWKLSEDGEIDMQNYRWFFICVINAGIHRYYPMRNLTTVIIYGLQNHIFKFLIFM